MRFSVCIAIIIIVSFFSCKRTKDSEAVPDTAVKEDVKPLNKAIEEKPEQSSSSLKPLDSLPEDSFVNLKKYSNDFVYDMKYATADNFLKTVVYECAECYTRVKTAKALMAANRYFLTKGYRIKFFDCYRPHDVQKKMWKIVSNPQYVADPTKGSIHNKGGAVDISLVDTEGNELDMGTAFDFFGKEAHHDYLKHSAEILKNRKLLKETMEKYGFWSIRTEWWHYNLSSASNDPIANFKWDCE